MRRLVCGTRNGVYGVVLDEPVPEVKLDGPWSIFTFHEIWRSEGQARLDPTVPELGALTTPVPGGNRWYTVVQPPGLPAGHEALVMHETDSVDYILVLSGSTELTLEDGSAYLIEKGDCLVQLGGLHSWHNRGSEPCVLLVVQLGAERGGGSH